MSRRKTPSTIQQTKTSTRLPYHIGIITEETREKRPPGVEGVTRICLNPIPNYMALPPELFYNATKILTGELAYE